jgi:VanZ family protein
MRHRSLASPLALAWAALVLYASLFPFSAWRWPPGQPFARLLLLPWLAATDAFDTWGNFAGYVPLGLLLAVAARRSGMRAWPALLLGALAPSLLSFACEVTQSFLPGRHPSSKDWALNSGGAFSGALLAAALQRLGLLDRWHAARERWFVRESAGALALLALWPLGLFFPTPLPLGLGQLGPRLREALVETLEDVPWAEGAYAMLLQPPPPERLWPPLEALASALGLLAPCLLAFVIVAPGWRRVTLVAGALALALAAMTLSAALNFGPQHALAWLMPSTLPALGFATVLALPLALAGRRLAAALGLVALAALVALVAQAPDDPYFAQSLQAWEQGRFVRFSGLAQWIAWLWPYAAIGWLLSRLGGRDS